MFAKPFSLHLALGMRWCTYPVASSNRPACATNNVCAWLLLLLMYENVPTDDFSADLYNEISISAAVVLINADA